MKISTATKTELLNNPFTIISQYVTLYAYYVKLNNFSSHRKKFLLPILSAAFNQ